MFDKNLVLTILNQINEALGKLKNRSQDIKSVEDFTNSPAGMDKLDSICMLFIAIGEALKQIDKITSGSLLSRYPDIDWKGVIGFRDIIAHHYFDIDAEQVFWICTHEVEPLSIMVGKIIKEFS